jgi:3,4-dihydroxy 2-butanone 4-phosphate synthase
VSEVVARALGDLRSGKFVLVYDADGREGETDLTIASEAVTPAAIRTMRKDGGGLICATFESSMDERLRLPYFDEVVADAAEHFPTLRTLRADDLTYDARSSFSLWVNHRKTFTGITDEDRALTVTGFADFVRRAIALGDGWASRTFGDEFRSPGHVPLVKAAPRLLLERRGHTELVTALMQMAGMTPTATICEMMGDDGRALSHDDAKRYAEARNLVFLEGSEILEAWRSWSE